MEYYFNTKNTVYSITYDGKTYSFTRDLSKINDEKLKSAIEFYFLAYDEEESCEMCSTIEEYERAKHELEKATCDLIGAFIIKNMIKICK